MKTGKKRMLVATSLAVGICVFAGAVFANYSASNGYNVYKKAIKGMIGLENYTLETNMAISIDGAVYARDTEKELYSKNGDVNLNKSSISYDNSYGDEDEYKQDMYFQDNALYRVYQGGEVYVYDGSKEHDYVPEATDYATLYNSMTGDKKTDERMVHFLELVADALVGDVKNNFVYLSGDENTDKYQLQLDTVQIPELFNAGISALFSAGNHDAEELYAVDDEYYQQNPMVLLGTDPVVKSVKSTFDVDKNGLLVNNVLSAELEGADKNGQMHTVLIEAEINLSDVGTTQPQRMSEELKKNIVFRESADRYQTEATIEVTPDGATHVITETEE